MFYCNVTDISEMFCNCLSLLTLPNISKWNTKNVKVMNYIFFGCSSLLNLPDINNWELDNVSEKNISEILRNSESSSNDISSTINNNSSFLNSTSQISENNLENSENRNIDYSILYNDEIYFSKKNEDNLNEYYENFYN